MSDLYKFLDELRAKLSIADVVGEKVKLVRKGREYSGLCPFHNEKTPSFTVNEAKGFYHCFGCGAHGDIIKFEMEANNLPFMDAVNKLANKAGLQVPQLSRETTLEQEKKTSQYDILEMACKFFEKNLRLSGGRPALDYLYNRGFDDEIIKKFRLGYAPNNNGLKAQLLSKGATESDLIELGLASLHESSSRIYDFFRDRVIIPIFDKKGRCIAFGGRILGDGQPKYLNSPETPVFNKRRVLYNLHNARDIAFERKAIIVCEGYMDVIALDKFGFSNAVAPLGTALTEDQIMEAWKICPEPTLCFDGDSAGQRAAVRSADRAIPILKAGYSLKYAFLPDKMDPDEYLKAKGVSEFEKILADTKPLIDVLWAKNVDGKDNGTPEQKALIEKTIMEEVAKIADEKVRNYYFTEIKNRVYNAFGKVAYQTKKSAPAKPQMSRPALNLDSMIARFIVCSVVAHPELAGEMEEQLAMLDVKDDVLKKLLYKITSIYQLNSEIGAREMYVELLNQGLERDLDPLKSEIAILINQDRYVIKENIELKLVEIHLRQLEAEIRECSRVIQSSESVNDEVFNKYESLKKEREALLMQQIV